MDPRALEKALGIEEEARALAERHHDLAPIFSVKRLFVQRQALGKFKPEELEHFDAEAAELSLLGESFSELAFARAATEFNGLQPPLAYQPADRTTLAHLDVALDRLALTPAPFRKRILQALAAALAADGTLSPTEAELLRAIAAALDCPLPPMLE